MAMAILGKWLSPVSASHSRIVLPADGDASIRPCGDHAMRPIAPVCPLSMHRSFTPGGRFFRTSSSARRRCSSWCCFAMGLLLSFPWGGCNQNSELHNDILAKLQPGNFGREADDSLLEHVVEIGGH